MGKCIKIFGTQILPPSRGNFYALTREVKFLCMDREAPYPRFCIKIQFVGQSIFFSFQLFQKNNTHALPYPVPE